MANTREELDGLKPEVDELTAERDTLAADNTRLCAEHAVLTTENAQFAASNEKGENAAMTDEVVMKRAGRDRLDSQIKTVQAALVA